MTTVSADVFIDPRLLSDLSGLEGAIENALDATAEAVRVDFQATVATWTESPEFIIERSRVTRIIGTNDENWARLNLGYSVPTRVARGRAMVFPANYRSKTVPRQLSSRQGGASGELIFRKRARGFTVEARDWNTVAAEKYQVLLPNNIQRAIDALI